MSLGRAVLGTLLFLLALPGAAQETRELTALLARVEGRVTLSPASRAELGSVRLAAQRQVLRGGALVHLPAGARATLVCSTDALVSLEGPLDWVLDAASCGRGRPLPQSSYRNMTTHAGRILPRSGALLLELEPRIVEAGLEPVLLSPRNTAILDARPPLVWTRATGALDYEIKLRGAVEMSIPVAAGDLQCGPGSGRWRDFDVCSWEPSGRWPALEPGKPVALSLGSRRTAAAPFRHGRESWQIQLLPVEGQRRVQEDLRQLAELPLDEASRLLLTAGVYARAGLYADAMAAYEEALQAQEMPEARVTLGDLYLTAGLTAPAEREYRQVLAGASSAARAAAEFGLGQAACFRRRFDDARAHFERACKLYTALGLPAEAEEARAAATCFEPSAARP